MYCCCAMYEGKGFDVISKITNLYRVCISQICRRYRKKGLDEFARNKYQSRYWLSSWKQEEEVLKQFKNEAGKQVTASVIKATLDEACGKDTGRVYVYDVLTRHG